MTTPIKYRISSTATKPVSDTVKGAPLTSLEIDGNFRSIKDSIELIQSAYLPAGYSAPVDYVAGVILSSAAQTVAYQGEVYAPKAAELPFTTSGVFEVAKFVQIQSVASVDLTATDGAAKIGYDGGTVQDVLDAVTGPSGAEYVGYTPAGTGAVVTDVQRALDEVVVSVLRFIPVSERAAIRAGTSTYDCTEAIQKALNFANKVYAPSGNYRTGLLYLNSNQEFFGDGAGTVLHARSDAETYILATHAFSGGTSNPADNKRNIYVHDLQIDQRKRDFGHNGFKHAMTINATTNMIVERVLFYDFRGDGCYVGAGTSNGLDRKNINIAFRDCVFDGRTKDVRNGISVIDCDGLVVDGCFFMNIGAPVASQSVGAIDFEPNNPWNTYRNVRIANCTFDAVDNTNSAAISFWVGNQVGNNNNIFNCSVSKNVFRYCYSGIVVNSVAKNAGSQDDVFVISENHFLDSINLDINLGGSKNVKITSNTFELTTPGIASYRGGIRVGLPSSGRALNAIDVLIFGNTFSGLRPQNGAVWLNSAANCKIESNTFNDVAGICIDFFSAIAAGLNQNLQNISIRNNTVTNRLKNAAAPVTTSYFMRQDASINNGTTNNSLISSTCFDDGNVLNDGVPRNAGGTTFVLNRETRSASPSAGSWNQGDIVWDSIPAAGAFAFACSVAGTFGTFANAPTGSATNGSNAITGITDPDTALRAGQWVTLTGDATPKRITTISYGKAVSVAVTAGGSSYVNGQTVVLSLSSSVRATGIATVVAGAITAITIVDGGQNFVTGDVVNIESNSAPSGSGATGIITAQTDAYLSSNFGGTTGAVTFAWSAPTFVVG